MIHYADLGEIRHGERDGLFSLADLIVYERRDRDPRRTPALNSPRRRPPSKGKRSQPRSNIYPCRGAADISQPVIKCSPPRRKVKMIRHTTGNGRSTLARSDQSRSVYVNRSPYSIAERLQMFMNSKSRSATPLTPGRVAVNLLELLTGCPVPLIPCQPSSPRSPPA